MTVTAYGRGGSGNVLWSRDLGAPGSVTDLAARAPAYSFNYVVTFDLTGVEPLPQRTHLRY